MAHVLLRSTPWQGENGKRDLESRCLFFVALCPSDIGSVIISKAINSENPKIKYFFDKKKANWCIWDIFGLCTCVDCLLWVFKLLHALIIFKCTQYILYLLVTKEIRTILLLLNWIRGVQNFCAYLIFRKRSAVISISANYHTNSPSVLACPYGWLWRTKGEYYFSIFLAFFYRQNYSSSTFTVVGRTVKGPNGVLV